MSSAFISPGMLVELVRLHGILEFSHIAGFACPSACENKHTRRAARKSVAAALRRAVNDGDLYELGLYIWQPRDRWSVIWDSKLNRPSPDDLSGQISDGYLSRTLATNWLMATERQNVEVYAGGNIDYGLFAKDHLLISARLQLSEFFWSRVVAGTNAKLLTRDDPQLQDGLNADEFPYLKYLEGQQPSVVVAPASIRDSFQFGIDLHNFREACHSVGYRCQVLSPRPPNGELPSFHHLSPSMSEIRPNKPE